MTINEIFLRITTALENAGVEYMLAGSFASTRYSAPRATQDIDIVISATQEQLQSFIQYLSAEDYYVELDAALETHRRESLFNVIDLKTGWKIDLIFRKSTPFGLRSSDDGGRLNYTACKFISLAQRTSASQNSTGRSWGLLNDRLRTPQASCE